METILLLAHPAPDGSLPRSAWEALGAAKLLATGIPGSTLAVGLAGEGAEKAAGTLAGAASRILAVSGAEFSVPRYATDALAAEALCRAAKATVVIAGATSRWSRALAGAARRLGGRFDSHLTGVSVEGGAVAASRWYYRQRMEAVISRAQRPWVLLVDPGCLPAAAPQPGKAAVEAVAVQASAACLRTTVRGARSAASGGETIRPDAKLLFVAGAGWTKVQADGKPHVEDANRLILDFLAASGASLGGSKSVVDLSGEGQAVLPFMTHLNQVGQTGATPRHPKGLSTCCHGEEPHVVGWRFITERRAVNLDPGCGWARGKADVVYVADAFQVVAKVNDLLRQRKG